MKLNGTKRKLTLDNAWKLCLRQWDWVADKIKKGDIRDVGDLKEEFLEENGFSDIDHNCFFCEYDEQNNGRCNSCPARLVDKRFHCRNKTYDFIIKPLKLRAKIHQLCQKYSGYKEPNINK